jgi:hypothetical protein
LERDRGSYSLVLRNSTKKNNPFGLHNPEAMPWNGAIYALKLCSIIKSLIENLDGVLEILIQDVVFADFSRFVRSVGKIWQQKLVKNPDLRVRGV